MKLTSQYLSSIVINIDKDWNYYNIYNVGKGRINVGTNQPLSPGLFLEDLGKNWMDMGAISATSGSIGTISYLGSGIVLFYAPLDDATYHLFESNNYGLSWNDLGDLNSLYGTSVNSNLLYCGNGIVLFGDSAGNVFRSTNYGKTWSNVGAVSSVEILTFVYCGNGIVLLGDGNGDVYKSTDYGNTWSSLIDVSSNAIDNIVYCENGTIVLTDSSSNAFRSTDYGATWVNLSVHIGRFMTYCGNGILVSVGTFPITGDVYRSIDYGLSWSKVYTLSESATSIAYLGNGVVVAGDDRSSTLYRSSDWGVTWTSLGNPSLAGIYSLVACNNGIALFGDDDGHVFRSDVAYKLDENELDCISSPVNLMDFWSDVDALVTLPADTALPNIVISGIPSGATVIRAILILKYSAKKDTSGSDNQITAGKITSKETTSGTYVDAINFINGEAKVTATIKEGGDVHPGDNDVSGSTSKITGNCTVQSVLSGVTTTGASIELYDVQIGIRVYFRFM